MKKAPAGATARALKDHSSEQYRQKEVTTVTTREDAIDKAISTLAELCDPIELPEGEGRYEQREAIDTRRRSAEAILDHYREQDTMAALKTISVQLNINGAVPVRPMTLSEVSA